MSLGICLVFCVGIDGPSGVTDEQSLPADGLSYTPEHAGTHFHSTG